MGGWVCAVNGIRNPAMTCAMSILAAMLLLTSRVYGGDFVSCPNIRGITVRFVAVAGNRARVPRLGEFEITNRTRSSVKLKGDHVREFPHALYVDDPDTALEMRYGSGTWSWAKVYPAGSYLEPSEALIVEPRHAARFIAPIDFDQTQQPFEISPRKPRQFRLHLNLRSPDSCVFSEPFVLD